jgi:hypothetical protein
MPRRKTEYEERRDELLAVAAPETGDVKGGLPWPGGYEAATARAVARMKELCGIPPTLGLPVASSAQWDDHKRSLTS